MRLGDEYSDSTGSAYLVACTSCSDCTYCTSRVGLSKEKFQILNQPYGPTEYFALIKNSPASATTRTCAACSLYR